MPSRGRRRDPKLLGLESEPVEFNLGWSTGLEPATTRTTIWGSTIELRPPSGIQILVFRRMIANAQRTPPVWHIPRFSLRRCPIVSLQPTFHLLSSAPRVP